MLHGPAAQATAPRVQTSTVSTIRTCGSAGVPVLAGRLKCAALRDCPPLPLRSLPLGSATLRTVPSLASTRSPCQRPSRHGPPASGRSRIAVRCPSGVPGAGRHTAATPGSGTARICPHSPASSRRNGLTCKKLSASDSDDAAGRSYPGSASRGRCAIARSVPAAVPGISARARLTCIASRGVIFRARRAGTPASASSSRAGVITADASPSPVPSRTRPGSPAIPAAARCPAVHAGPGAAAPGSAPHATIPDPGPGSSSSRPPASFQIAGIAITSARPASASRAGRFRRAPRRGAGRGPAQDRRRRPGVT